MNINVYAIYDVKASMHQAPFFMPTDGAATRALSDVVNEGKSQIAKHPRDFALYCIGTFDDVAGELKPAPKRFIVEASSLIVEQPTGDLLEFNRGVRA